MISIDIEYRTSRVIRGLCTRRYTVDPVLHGCAATDDDGRPGFDVAGPDGSTKEVKPVPCGAAAHETDGSTTCVGIQAETKRRP